MFNLILFGPPGSGKGTQATEIESKYGLNHISTGELFRYELKNDTDIGKEIKNYLDNGQLVPDEITIGMLKKKILSFTNPNGFLLDGFPRNINQAASLDQLFVELNSEVNLLVSLDIGEDEIIKRILNRGKTSGRSDDNDVNIIKSRFKVYQDVTQPVFDYYKKEGKSKAIDGVGTIDQIFNRICCVIDEIKK